MKPLFSSYLPLTFFIGMKSRERKKILCWSLDSSPVIYRYHFLYFTGKETYQQSERCLSNLPEVTKLISLITICFFSESMPSFEEKSSLSLIFRKSSKNPPRSLMATELMQHIVYLAWILRPVLLGRTSFQYMICAAVDVSCQSGLLLPVLTGEMSSPRATMQC